MPNNEFGDFQTPLPLARLVVKTLERLAKPGRVLEPTCGLGNFLQAAKEVLTDSELLGIEAQSEYSYRARTISPVMEQNIFDLNLSRDLEWKSEKAPLLVVGNPPWVTNSQLSMLGSENRPVRENIRRLRGIDAMTGSSNFDIAEYIWLKLIAELMDQQPVISMLCKTQVARNVLSFCADNNWPVGHTRMHHIDARQWFGAAVDACLFTVEVARDGQSYDCDVYESLESERPVRRMGVVSGRLVADLDSYAKSQGIDGNCPLEWRQGVKHDASSVMELREDQGPVTKAGVRVEVEDEYLFPLLKSTDVFRGRISSASKWMIVPQRRLSDDTALLASSAPKLWRYLNENAEALDGRKSTIYRSRPRFCVFGLGDYTFAPYKVAISGLHKSLEFRVVGQLDKKPVVFDDTCYFLSFSRGLDCAIVGALLSSQIAKELLASMVFIDSKRPVTKKLLKRIDLGALANLVNTELLVETVLKVSENLGAFHSEQEILERLSFLSDSWGSGEGEREFVATREDAETLF